MPEPAAAAQWNEKIAHAVIARHAGERAPLLVVLQALEEAFGYLPDAAIPLVAGALNLSRAEVHGVATFYHDFHHHAPRGRHSLRICRAEACQAVGGERLAEHAKKQLGIQFGETTANGALTLESVYCLGLCACAPAAMLDSEPAGRLSEAGIDKLIQDSRS